MTGRNGRKETTWSEQLARDDDGALLIRPDTYRNHES